jgi:DNA-binding Xre family transcriptional regulator
MSAALSIGTRDVQVCYGFSPCASGDPGVSSGIVKAHERLLARLIAEKAKRRLRSDAALAREIGMSPGWISALKGKGVGKNLSRLDAIAAKLGVDVTDLLSPPDVTVPDTSQTRGTDVSSGLDSGVTASGRVSTTPDRETPVEVHEMPYTDLELWIHAGIHNALKAHGDPALVVIKKFVDDVWEHGLPKAGRRTGPGA